MSGHLRRATPRRTESRRTEQLRHDQLPPALYLTLVCRRIACRRRSRTMPSPGTAETTTAYHLGAAGSPTTSVARACARRPGLYLVFIKRWPTRSWRMDTRGEWPVRWQRGRRRGSVAGRRRQGVARHMHDLAQRRLRAPHHRRSRSSSPKMSWRVKMRTSRTSSRQT